jgi:dihydrofolate reductase
MAKADRIELTRVHGSFQADTYFPNIAEAEWKLMEKKHHDKDDRHNYAFDYLTYVKANTEN